MKKILLVCAVAALTSCTTSKSVTKTVSSSDTTHIERIDTLSHQISADTSVIERDDVIPEHDDSVIWFGDWSNDIVVDTVLTAKSRRGTITVHKTATSLAVNCHEDELKRQRDSMLVINNHDKTVIQKLITDKVRTQSVTESDTTKTNTFWKYVAFLLMGVVVVLGFPYIIKLIKLWI